MIEGNLTLEEAIILARRGIKMSHTYFTPDEYLTMIGNQIIFEDGVKIFLSEWTKGKDYLNLGWRMWVDNKKTNMIPSNEIILDKYHKRYLDAKNKIKEVTLFYNKIRTIKEESLSYDLQILGCKVMLSNLKGEIEHCYRQFDKFKID